MSLKAKKTAKDAAAWMAAEIAHHGLLEQGVAASYLADNFGDSFVYDNNNGGLSISKEVLAEFRKRTEKTVVWERSGKCWRLREPLDGRHRLADGT